MSVGGSGDVVARVGGGGIEDRWRALGAIVVALLPALGDPGTELITMRVGGWFFLDRLGLLEEH